SRPVPPWAGIQAVKRHMAEEQQGPEQGTETIEAPKAQRKAPRTTTVNGRATVEFREPPADFDWEAVEDDKKVIPSEKREKMEKAYEDTLSSISEKEVLMGTVVGMNKKEVVINIGYKSEGVVPISAFRYKPDLKLGDKVEVYIEKQEDKGGQMVISHKT